MPDPIAKVFLTTESNRKVGFEFKNFPEIQNNGESLSSIQSGPASDNPNISFGTPVITGTQIWAPLIGLNLLSDGTEFKCWITALTNNGNPLTCAGEILVEDPTSAITP